MQFGRFTAAVGALAVLVWSGAGCYEAEFKAAEARARELQERADGLAKRVASLEGQNDALVGALTRLADTTVDAASALEGAGRIEDAQRVLQAVVTNSLSKKAEAALQRLQEARQREATCSSPQDVRPASLIADPASYAGKCVAFEGEVSVSATSRTIWSFSTSTHFGLRNWEQLGPEIKAKLVENNRRDITVVGVFDPPMGLDLIRISGATW